MNNFVVIYLSDITEIVEISSFIKMKILIENDNIIHPKIRNRVSWFRSPIFQGFE